MYNYLMYEVVFEYCAVLELMVVDAACFFCYGMRVELQGCMANYRMH